MATVALTLVISIHASAVVSLALTVTRRRAGPVLRCLVVPFVVTFATIIRLGLMLAIWRHHCRLAATLVSAVHLASRAAWLSATL